MGKYFWIFIFCIGFLAPTAVFGRADSIGVKLIKGVRYIEHKVDKGEGLYGIARKYNVDVATIRKDNPGKSESLNIGDILLVRKPMGKAPAKSDAGKKTINEPSKTGTQKTDAGKGGSRTHTVKKGETLYSIARDYKVTAADIKNWNRLHDNSLQAGQKLVIYSEASPDPKNAAPIKSRYGDKISGHVVGGSEEIEDAPHGKTKQIQETGVATFIDDGSVISKKAMALHATAPRGTVMLVTNPMNGNSIYVEIVGKLVNTDPSESTLIKMTRAAAERLGARDKFFKVNLSYAVPE